MKLLSSAIYFVSWEDYDAEASGMVLLNKGSMLLPLTLTAARAALGGEGLLAYLKAEIKRHRKSPTMDKHTLVITAFNEVALLS